MSKRRKLKTIRCAAYLAVQGDLNKVDEKERKQLHCIREYAKAHNIDIVNVYHSAGAGVLEVNRQFEGLVSMVRDKKIDGILVKNMQAISKDVSDAYLKVSKVRNAGGYMITVDEGELMLRLTMGG